MAIGTDAHAWLLPLLRVVSPSLPIGGYAYSRGLEYAVHAGTVHDEASAGVWIIGLLQQLAAGQDGPLFLRLYTAFERSDVSAAETWNARLLASRESAELRLEDTQLGAALARWLWAQRLAAVEVATPWLNRTDVCHATLFALTAVTLAIPRSSALLGLLWQQAEGQVSAAVRLVPLGQTSGQRLLTQVVSVLPECARYAEDVADEDIGAFAPGLAIASALHETQYSRLFRS